MKNSRKILSIVLALLMVVSLFAACGDKDSKTDKEDKGTKTEQTANKDENNEPSSEKKEEKVSILGDWEAVVVEEGMSVKMTATFKEDGTIKLFLSEDAYEDLLLASLETDPEMAKLSDEEKQAYVEILKQNAPYELVADEFNSEGTWELDGDKLTVTIDGEALTAETGLSKGEKTFTFTDEGETITFTKK